MVKLVVGTLGVAFRILLRYWARNNIVLSESVVDIEQFALQCGLSIFEARKFNRSIDDLIDIMAENFIKEFGEQIENQKRREVIFIQIQEDIGKVIVGEKETELMIFNSEILRNHIIMQSEKERETWSSEEVGLYMNCVRYISKAGMEFIYKLPNFTPKVLGTVLNRQEEYQKELYKILMDIHSMTSLIKGVGTTYREYEGIYRDKLVEKYSKVELIGSGINNARNVTRYDISSAYVELSCVNGEAFGEEIELSQVFTNSNVVWIKGEAGSGKTTFLQWVAVCAAKNEYSKIENIKNTIPIIIELRNTDQPSNLQNAVNRITSIYGSNCPDNWILDLMEQNRLILLFDGLDEVSQVKREEVYKYIEGIVHQYPQIKILLTARNSVKDRIACKNTDYEILPMKIDNIKKFITYWHRSVLRKDAIISDQEIDKLQFNLKKKIVDNQSLKVLAKNPLLCAMICTLNYVNSEQLPDNKMELYEKCCEMLMDARDNQREINRNIYQNISQLGYNRKRKILEEMAYWMMNGNVSSKSRSNAIQYLEHLLKDTNILLNNENKYSAEDILNFLIDRSGIIREPEDGIIDFIHKTFMEFLTVKAICRNCDWDVLVREACSANWKETIIMCFQEMRKEDIEDVLSKLILKGEITGDERYILIASVCASNAVFLSNKKIKEKIDTKIMQMIPPRQRDLSEIANAGIYLLPFLQDVKEYTNEEKDRCLQLLERIGKDEIIPTLLSYIEGNGNDSVKIYAIDILSRFNNSVLEEYNVREQLVKIFLDIINGDSLTIYECMTNIIGNEVLTDKDIEKIEKVKCIHFICGVSNENMHMWNTEIFRYFRGCNDIILSGIIRSAYFLNQFMYLNDLTIKAEGDISEVVRNLQNIRNLMSIKNLYIEAAQLHYFHEQDLYAMKNIETFEIHCLDDELQFSINNFDYFPNLRKVVIDVNDLLARKVRLQVPVWRGRKDDLEIVVCTGA